MRCSGEITDCDLLSLCIKSEVRKVFVSYFIKICDKKIKIPMTGGFESFNVSVATGVILYEVMK